MKLRAFVLLIVVIAFGVLVGLAAFILVAVNPPPAQYLSDNTPQGAAYNYHLAIIRREYSRAYSYLSPRLPHYPASADAFETDLLGAEGARLEIQRCVYSLGPDGVESMTFEPGMRVQITLFEQWYSGPWCTNNRPDWPRNLSHNNLLIDLVYDDIGWRVVSSTGHFPACWTDEDMTCGEPQ